MWGSYADRSQCIQYSERCPANQALATEGQILFAPTRAGAPHLRGFIFKSLARQRLRAAEGAMGGGKHFKIRPPDKEDAFPPGVSTACGGATPTRRSVSGIQPMPAGERSAGSRGPNSLRAPP